VYNFQCGLVKELMLPFAVGDMGVKVQVKEANQILKMLSSFPLFLLYIQYAYTKNSCKYVTPGFKTKSNDHSMCV
jgi:hypothetical protein